MQYEQAKELSAPEFKRLFGVQRHTFAQMVEMIGQSAQLKKQSGSPQLSFEEQVLVALPYWHEYRTYSHMAQD